MFEDFIEEQMWFEVTINDAKSVEMSYTEFMRRFHHIKQLADFAGRANPGETTDYFVYATNYRVYAKCLEG